MDDTLPLVVPRTPDSAAGAKAVVPSLSNAAIQHELKLVRRAMELVETHLDLLDKAIAVALVPATTIIKIDLCPDYPTDDTTWYAPPEEM